MLLLFLHNHVTIFRIFVSDAKTLGYDNLFFPIAVLTVGIALAAVGFFIEKAVNLCGRKKKRRRRRRRRGEHPIPAISVLGN